MKAPVSVLILTLNEAVNLPECLETLQWCDDIVVLDSGSQDSTQQIASARGVRLYERVFDDYASQRNYGLHEIPYKYAWVLMVDADERWPVHVAEEICLTLERSRDTSLYFFLRKDMFMGRWLRRSSGYPTWFGRLVKPADVVVERAINEEYHTKGKVGYMEQHFIHYPFNKGMAYWFERHNRYSSMEAEALVQETLGDMPWRSLFSSAPTKRRRALKQLAYRLPGRPWLVFLYLYVWRMGFLDGMPGLMFSRMRKMYEAMIDLKVKELRQRGKGLSL